MKPQDRFYSEGQGYFGPRENPMTETHCNVWDWDRLRMVKVKGAAKLFPPDEDREIPILAQFADYLSPEVCAVTADDDGLLAGASTDPEEDDTPFVAYFPISVVESLGDCRTVQYSKLQEVDRLGPGVDLSSYEDDFGIPHKVAFKFNPLDKPQRLQMAWDELNLLKSLPPHPNRVPFDRIVREDVESRVIGFTTKYISGGTLDNTNVPSDLSGCNSLPNSWTSSIWNWGSCIKTLHPIFLFDFDWAANGKKRLLEGRDGVTAVVFTLYELITNDTQFTSIPHWNRTLDMVQSISEWTCNRELDCDVSKLRNFLNDWVATRKSDGDLERCLNAPNRLTWPELPTAPDYNVPFELGKISDGEPIWTTGPRFRRTAMEKGQYCFLWVRPPQSKLLNRTKSDALADV